MLKYDTTIVNSKTLCIKTVEIIETEIILNTKDYQQAK